jgi:hypothetical protein
MSGDSEMVERVARAIDPEADWDGRQRKELAEIGLSPNTTTGFAATLEPRKAKARERARAAILAMREPTEDVVMAMIDAWPARHERSTFEQSVKKIWAGGIDAALGQK